MKVSPSMTSEFAPLRSVMDALTEGFGLLAPDFTILELNAQAVAIDGRQREELIGRSHWEVYP
jgi:PAS domain-containing protein